MNSFYPSQQAMSWILILRLFSGKQIEAQRGNEPAEGHTAHFSAIAPASLSLTHVVILNITLFFKSKM